MAALGIASLAITTSPVRGADAVDPNARSAPHAATAAPSAPDFFDGSGHGAVLCVHRITVEVLTILETCFPENYVELRQDLRNGLAATHAFIVANSQTPVTLAELDANVAAYMEEFSTRIAALPDGKRRAACRAQETETIYFATSFFGQTRTSRQATFDHLLAVPRPPAMNPCL